MQVTLTTATGDSTPTPWAAGGGVVDDDMEEWLISRCMSRWRSQQNQEELSVRRRGRGSGTGRQSQGRHRAGGRGSVLRGGFEEFKTLFAALLLLDWLQDL
jgi:hypothetical protein